MLPETYLISDIQYEKPYTKKIDFETSLDSEEQTEEKLISELREKATQYLEQNKYPQFSYTVKSDVNQSLEIGDTIHVLHPIADILTEVLEYEYNVVSQKVKSLVFGNFTRDVETKFNNIKTSIEQLNQNLSKQNIVINKQTEIINTLNKNGYVYIDENEILILDSIPKNSAKNVWRFGLGGIGFSSNGYEGPFETAITMDGQINADFITTGMLSVDRIEGLFEQISITVSNSLKTTDSQIEELQRKNEELKIQLDGIINTVSSSGGNNIFFYAKEYWKGSTDNSEATLEEYTNTLIQQNNISDEGYLINNGVSIQSQVVKNGSYAISFNYYKLKADATGYIKVNGTEYKLDGNAEVWNEITIIVEITTNNIKIEIGSDTIASYYVADLMVATGTEKSVWTQNANETRTDTVEIGKGIQVNSSTKNVYTRIDADGNRTFNSSTNERVAEMTDKGVYSKQLEVKEQAKINLLLIQQVGNQVWLNGLEG